MSQARTLMHDIDKMVTARNPAECGRLFQRLANLYQDFSLRADQDQLSVFDDVFLRLLPGCDRDTLLGVTRHWAHAAFAPRQTLIALALYPAHEFSIPVLVHAKALTDHDLLEIARQASPTQQLVLATRAGLPALVSDYLISAAGPEVRDVLVANQSAHYSKAGAILRDSLTNKPSHPQQAPDMAALVLQTKLGMVALASALNENGDTEAAFEDLIEPLLQHRLWSDVMAMVALKAGLSAAAVLRVFAAPDYGALLQIGRALGWSWRCIALLLGIRMHLAAPQQTPPPSEQDYQKLDPLQAQLALDFLVRRSRQRDD